MKEVKIVFSDLDSTLTKEQGIIDIKNKAIFDKLANIGIPVVLNTGRSLTYTIPICKQFNTSNYVITSNGAEVYNFITKKMIYRSVISKENLLKLDDLIKKYNLYFLANGIDKRYTNNLDDSVGFFVTESLSSIDDEIAQVVLESYDLDKMMNLRKDLEKDTDLLIANKTKHVENGKLLYYDLVNKDVSKGNALEILCNYLNIDVKSAMAIGDSDNDIDMFKKAGYPVAVANASDNVKEYAKIVTLSNKQDGVFTILNELYSSLIK